jgi:predicted glutamine amidotransferase
MCELFAMSSRSASLVHYSLDEFSKHGGNCYKNRDGWGIVFYQTLDAYTFKDPEPASDSALAEMVAHKDVPSRYLMAHVRLASQGEPALENTHPFRRTIGGHVHHFAHNGDLEGYIDKHEGSPLLRQCIGITDSELAFMDLLARLDKRREQADDLLSLDNRFNIFADFAAEMTNYGSANFLYCDGDALFVHAHRRRYETANGRSEPRPPGLHMRYCTKTDEDGVWQTKGAGIQQLDPETILFASVPLNDSGWEELPEGCAIVVKDGREYARKRTLND